MIKTITISNYKSIQNLTLELGRVNLLIGENGAGKSNILEGIALLSAAIAERLDNEFLTSRGIRVTDPTFMRSAFEKAQTTTPICLSVSSDDAFFRCQINHDNAPYSKWTIQQAERHATDTGVAIRIPQSEITNDEPNNNHRVQYKPNIDDFIIYSPENSALRTFEREGQIEPLGINGEGLLKLLWVISQSKDQEQLETIKGMLRLVSWFDDFEIPLDQVGKDGHLNFKDRFIDAELTRYSQRSANEGILFLLFYAALLVSGDTPKFFAIDNIDASLNPKLCWRLIQEIVQLAKIHDKQVILTTHNPAVLDGLNLDDTEQRLLVVSRNKQGYTKVNALQKPSTMPNEEPIKLSEAFLSGMIGGLPKNF